MNLSFYQAMQIGFLLILVSSCSLFKSDKQPDSNQFLAGDGLPDGSQLDFNSIPDALPKAEPLSATGNMPYVVFGRQYKPLGEAAGFQEKGRASWYGTKFHGRKTSSGEPYDMFGMSAAHRTLPLPSYVKVTNQANGRSVVVKVNDRGPFIDTHLRVIDLSYAAAGKLGMIGTGTAEVVLEGLRADDGGVKQPTVSVSAVSEYYIQAGAFSQASNVKQLKQTLASEGIRSFVDKRDDLYKVKVGPFDNIEEALKQKLTVDRVVGTGALVVMEPQ